MLVFTRISPCVKIIQNVGTASYPPVKKIKLSSYLTLYTNIMYHLDTHIMCTHTYTHLHAHFVICIWEVVIEVFKSLKKQHQ